MTLDTSVMNVSVATVAKDVGMTVTGIQNLGASIGTALAGSILIAPTTSSFSANIQQSPRSRTP
jgi:hypothetical protein